MNWDGSSVAEEGEIGPGGMVMAFCSRANHAGYCCKMATLKTIKVWPARTLQARIGPTQVISHQFMSRGLHKVCLMIISFSFCIQKMSLHFLLRHLVLAFHEPRLQNGKSCL